MLAALGVVTWLALTPAPPESVDLGWDKANHTVAFFVLAVLVYCSLVAREWWGWLALAGYGIVIEVTQWLLGYRVFELTDLIANCTGIVFCILCQKILIRLPLIKTIKDI